MKPFYADYANHALRFYVRHRNVSEFRCPADQHNWEACDEVYRNLPVEQQTAVSAIYQQYGMIHDAVVAAAETLKVDPPVLWKLVSDVSAEVARVRGLM